MSAFEITANLSISVDKSTAEACLKIAEIYANRNGMTVTANTSENGEVKLSYEPFIRQL